MFTSQLVEGHKYVYSTIIVSVLPWILCLKLYSKMQGHGGETEGLEKSHRSKCDVKQRVVVKKHFRFSKRNIARLADILHVVRIRGTGFGRGCYQSRFF